MRIVFVDGTSGFRPTRRDEQATGGILSSLTILPRLLAKQGHDVVVKSVYSKNEVIDGVEYKPHTSLVEHADVVVFNRNVISRHLVSQAKQIGAKVFWWLHDVVDPRYLNDGGFKDVDGIIALSEYCKRTYAEFYEIDPKKFVVIPNGVDKDTFYPGDYSKRDPFLIIHASAPIKGMKPLGFTITNLKRLDPKYTLRMYASQGLHDKQDDSLVRFILQKAKEQGAEIEAPIPQRDLAEVMRKAWLLLMPNSYPEICSNLLLQARASGLPVIATATGSIPEFLSDGEHGVITKSGPLDLYFWWREFALETVKLAQDKERHRKLSNQTPAGVQSWETIASLWGSYLAASRQLVGA